MGTSEVSEIGTLGCCHKTQNPRRDCTTMPRPTRSGLMIELALMGYYLIPTLSLAALAFAITKSAFWALLAMVGTFVAMVARGVIRGCD
jgi:hypothetical protein